jgi:hypothetical protein
VHFDWYLSPELASDEQYINQCLEASEKVQQEDVWLCERVQKGLDSSRLLLMFIASALLLCLFDATWPLIWPLSPLLWAALTER